MTGFYRVANKKKGGTEKMRILTTDIYEGAYLLSKGMTLKNIWEDSKQLKKSVVFEFEGNNIEILKKAYLKGQAKANVIRLKTNLNELKDIMFNLLRDKRLRENELRGEKHVFKREKTQNQKIHR